MSKDKIEYSRFLVDNESVLFYVFMSSSPQARPTLDVVGSLHLVVTRHSDMTEITELYILNNFSFSFLFLASLSKPKKTKNKKEQLLWINNITSDSTKSSWCSIVPRGLVISLFLDPSFSTFRKWRFSYKIQFPSNRNHLTCNLTLIEGTKFLSPYNFLMEA